MAPRTRAEVMGLLAILTALAAISLSWRGNVSGAIVAGLNGITIALVALGWQVAAK